jgi:protease-4
MKWLKILFKLLFIIIVIGFVVSALFYYTKKEISEFTGDKIVVLDLNDIIYESESTIKRFQKYEKNDKVKGFILRINSPGGAVGPSQEMYSYIKNMEKPVYVAMKSLATSGGYYVAAAADKIYALPGTITGSIGVIIKFPNFKELYKKIGIDITTIKSGKFKDIGSSSRELTEDERELLQQTIDEVYQQFVQDILSTRPVDNETLLQYADGRILVGSFAKKINLVDELGTYLDAFEQMKKDYDFKDATIYIYEDKKTFFEKLLENVTYFKNKFDTSSYLFYLYDGY